MKKLISILVAFAMLAGAVFAQDEGSWSVSGSGKIGTRLNFLPLENTSGELDVSHWENWADGWDEDDNNVRGNLDVMYSKGGLSTGFGFNQLGSITAKLSYGGENFNFGAEQNIKDMFDGGNRAHGSLWGNYTFQVLNGIEVKAHVKSETEEWKTTGIFDTFSKKDNFLLFDVSPMAGLNIGLKLPQMFYFDDAIADTPKDFVNDVLQNLIFGAQYADGPIGVAFQLALLGEATKINDKGEVVSKRDADLNAGIYLGFEYKINDQMTAGLALTTTFGGQKIILSSDDGKLAISDAVGLNIGASFSYSDGPLGAGITLKFSDNDTATISDFSGMDSLDPTDPDDQETIAALMMKYSDKAKYFDHNQTFGISAYVQYDVVENYLQAKFEADLGIVDKLEKVDGDTPVYASVLTYTFKPQLFFNFLGTGAGDWNTGFAVRYVASGPKGFFEPNKGHNNDNFMEIVFKWSF